MSSTSTQRLLSLAEASQISGYHQDYLGALARQGKLAASKVGRNWVISKEALNEFLGVKPETTPEDLDEEAKAGELGKMHETLFQLKSQIEAERTSQVRESLRDVFAAVRKQLDRSHNLGLFHANRLHRIHVAKDLKSSVHPSLGKKYSAGRQLYISFIVALVSILFLWCLFLTWVFLK